MNIRGAPGTIFSNSVEPMISEVATFVRCQYMCEIMTRSQVTPLFGYLRIMASDFWSLRFFF
jgi:hypothetical protein